MKSSEFKVDVKCLGQEEVNLSEFERQLATFYQVNVSKPKRRKSNHYILILELSKQNSKMVNDIKLQLMKILNLFKKRSRNYVSIMLYSSDFECYRILNPIKCETESYMISDIETFIETEVKSQPLTMLSTTLKQVVELSHHDTTFSNQHVILLSDRMWHVDDGNFGTEIEKCQQFINQLITRDVSIHVFGLGKYYDRSLFVTLFDGLDRSSLRHLEDGQTYYKYFMQSYHQINATIPTELNVLNHHFFIVDEQQLYKVPKKKISFRKKGTNIIVTFDGSLKLNQKTYPVSHELVSKAVVEELGYHLTYYHLKQQNLKSALNTILYTGNTDAYNHLKNSYSCSELAQSTEFIYSLILQPAKRNKMKKEWHFPLPIEEEPICLIEVLHDIEKDEQSMLLWNYAYSYQHIGPRQALLEDDFIFHRCEVGYTKVKRVLIGTKKLNIGLLVEVQGQVENSNTHLKLDAHIYREYNLVLNGNLNVNEICCVLSKTMKSKLKNAKLLKRCFKYGQQEICVINLSKISIVNQRLLRSFSPQELVYKLYQSETLYYKEATIKRYLKACQLQLDKKIKPKRDELSEIKKSYRVNDQGLYHPLGITTVPIVSQNGYLATILEWKISKFPQKCEVDKAEVEYARQEFETGDEYVTRLSSIYQEITEKRNQLLFDVQLARLCCGITKENMFLFEDRTVKKKVESDPLSKENNVVNGTMIESTKAINGILLRQLEYQVKVRI